MREMYIEELYDEEKISSYLVVSYTASGESHMVIGNGWYH